MCFIETCLSSDIGIGANVAEAEKGHSKADFSYKMNIALKEANETYYWLRLLYKTEYITENQFKSLEQDVLEIGNILGAICKTSSGQ